VDNQRGLQAVLQDPQQAGDQLIPRLLGVLQNGLEPPLIVHSISLRRPSLEDVFIKLTGRAIREEEASPLEMMRLRHRLWSRR